MAVHHAGLGPLALSRSLRSAPSGKLRDFGGDRARVGCFGLLCGCFEPAWTSHIDQKTHLYSILLHQHSKISDACGITPADTITKKDLFIGMENSSVLVHFDFRPLQPPSSWGASEHRHILSDPPGALGQPGCFVLARARCGELV